MSEDKAVIVATDGSDHSLRILPHAHELAEDLGAPLRLVRIVEEKELSGGGNDEQAVRERIMEEMARDLRRFGLTAEREVIVAPAGKTPADTLVDLATQGAILAMHSRGRGLLARLFLGSVATSVIQQTKQPVMVGGPELLPPPAGEGPYRLLVTSDLSPDADNALREISPLLTAGNFEVTLLNVYLTAPQGIDNDAQRAKSEAELEEKRSLLPESVPVETRVREIPIGGGIDTAILEVADEIDAQAIVMATHGQSARRQVLLGSVALSVLGRSTLPLIIATRD